MSMLYLFGLGAWLISAVSAQVQNSNPNCAIGALPQDGATVYYAPTDSGNIEIFAQAIGQCDSGSSADVSFYATYQDSSAGNFISDCGSLPLDGNPYVLDCGIPKGSIPEGSYHFDIQIGAAGDALDRFNIVHHQATSTAAASTSTVTSTTYESTDTTTTVTSTNTATSAPVTTTVPAATVDSTQTVTPPRVTNTVTKTRTRTFVKEVITVCQKTITSTAHCTSPTLKPCPKQTAAAAHHPHQKRQQNGYTVTGDGPLTTTVTPSGTVVTTTVDGGTTTDTDTAYTTVTTTVAATPSIVTVYSGSLTDVSTTTLSPVTTVVTAHTVVKTTITRTVDIPWYHYVRTTPICTPTKKGKQS
ncbi:hypothetical protein K461DRAFT_279055 [Myriangium duriaei CBS 260.36]|uniref:Uncharacterized protein n=1 Tax=Myriangium duriaei CBS 260.36 TaxID=1168546 RepID=A0A9P4IZI0_9PEZI|nr:hypothetical protein K461DRAFT_279055 [Myriangium duriaei CBS 260.36]